MDSARIDGILYDRGAYGQDRDVPAGAVDRRSAVGRVESRVASYDLREGEATYLKPGAPLYAVEGYDPSFRLAARRDGGWALYEVAHNPGAEKASELLDVGGKVESIGVEDTFEVGNTGPEEVATVRGQEKVGNIVDATLDAPLGQISRGSFRYLVVFHLEDGTRSIRWYELRSGELYLSENPSERDPYTGVVLPGAHREAIRRALPG
ncbi:MAG: hypothetical protein AVDCRST_MAG22-872 [uncultured Rubrobacteraceae bacterium]|uniref:Uncharacterized protein n=1 Tax=uncultured Rubrobacteraceae bacterium TaxID=349277 RepID=A0A6J4NSR0_9ACTN|nr:MAG: hypothetical protein AVDCRST_MAG22-872 [uncultured Rubrobacteraceae bacterium]